MSKIFFPLLPTPLQSLKTLRAYFRHSKAPRAYAVFVGKQLRYWSTTRVGADNWASRMLWDTYAVEPVARDFTIGAP